MIRFKWSISRQKFLQESGHFRQAPFSSYISNVTFVFAQLKVFNLDLKEPETDLDLKMDKGVGQVYCQSIIRKNIWTIDII